MTSQRVRQLEAAGINVSQALERVMGNEVLLERLLTKFLDDPQYQTLCTALKDGDEACARAASHALKGMCGNLSMTELFQLFTVQVEALRSHDLVVACGMMEEITPAYKRVAAAIRENPDGQT